MPADNRPSSLNPSPAPAPSLARQRSAGTSDDYSRLHDVLLASPRHLAIVPCNKVSEDALEKGQSSCGVRASEQHRRLSDALAAAGVRVRTVRPVGGLADLAFTRDTSLMTPWGLIGLRPGAVHRRAEVDAVLDTVRAAGLPVLGRITEGRIEGGDICLLRPGHLVIGLSGLRTDLAGATALARWFELRGWTVTTTPVDPDLLHLDTHFCMAGPDHALACVEKLQPDFVAMIESLGIELLAVTPEEVLALGCNILALGDRRIISTGSAPRVDDLLRQRGYAVEAVSLDEFTQCGGGVHCLTMPLHRGSGAH
ncbi:dimethylarginine dimethylaminohydrolase family protein [Sphingomonas humi]|uniref:arginine deiminase n=1 Tax=Sphingomonas humi TaxID=335630 RepID=A0ABP7RWQ3_9SPHN